MTASMLILMQLAGGGDQTLTGRGGLWAKGGGGYDCGEFMAFDLDKPNRRGNIPNTILLARKPQVDGYRDQVGAMVQQLWT